MANPQRIPQATLVKYVGVNHDLMLSMVLDHAVNAAFRLRHAELMPGKKHVGISSGVPILLPKGFVSDSFKASAVPF